MMYENINQKLRENLSEVELSATALSETNEGTLCETNGENDEFLTFVKTLDSRRCELSEAFSLVELMLSLIIISLIAAAFVPVITKKLTTNTITAGTISTNCAEKFGDECKACTQDVCLSCKKTCNSDEILDYATCSCGACGDGICKVGGLYVTQYNMNDNSNLNIPQDADITLVKAGNSCGANNDYTSKCCWWGETTDSSSCDGENGSYSGCNRTVCNWAAANAICSNFKYKGREWRLPTTSEMFNLAQSSIGLKDNGLMLCDQNSGYSSSQCFYANKCPGSYDGYSNTYSVWSTIISNSTNANLYSLRTGLWTAEQNNRTFPFSVRCVANVTVIPNCLTYSSDGESCEKCKSGYRLSNRACETDPYYLNVEGLYVTKYNMGDNNKTQIPASAGVTVVNTGETCGSADDYTSKCCWKGDTADLDKCNSDNGTYSGCGRTVCNWAAANAICENYNQDGKTWRLATSEEASKWGSNSLNKGNDGLMICEKDTGYSSSVCNSFTYYNCYGSRDNYCAPDTIWLGDFIGEYPYRIFLNSANYSIGADAAGRRSLAASVRCVAESVANCESYYSASGDYYCSKCKNGYYVTGTKTCTKSTEVANCKTYAANSDACTECKNGYKLSNGKCIDNYYLVVDGLRVTKYNMGDTTDTAIPSGAGVTKVSTGTNCTSEKCCWQGTTSTICDSTNGNYSGCSRTACNWAAANAICKSYNHDGKSWRLPTTSEVLSWANYSAGLGNDGLMLCSYGSGYNFSQCSDSTNCIGASNNVCSLATVPTDYTYNSGSDAKYLEMTSTPSISNPGASKKFARSVRCVTSN